MESVWAYVVCAKNRRQNSVRIFIELIENQIYGLEGNVIFLSTKSSREVMQDLLTTRKELSNGILSFKETDFEKTGLHPTYGKMNLLQWLNFFLLHEAHHLFTIFKIAAELKRGQAVKE